LASYAEVLAQTIAHPNLFPSWDWIIAVLFSNAFLVELVFNWPGFSKYGINAMLRKDLKRPLRSGVEYWVWCSVIANILVDVTVAWLDPRIRLGVERQK